MCDGAVWSENPTPPPDFSPVAEFCAGADDPVPMPGAFSPVFNTHVEPPGQHFFYDACFESFSDILGDTVLQAYTGWDVLIAMGFTPEKITEKLLSVLYVASAVQTSRAHASVGLGASRLSNLTPPKLPDPLSRTAAVFGEFQGPDDRKWILSDFVTTVDSLVRCAVRIKEGVSPSEVASTQWLPTRVDDYRTTHVLASRLSGWLKEKGFHVGENVLRGSVFSGSIPPVLEAQLGRFSFCEREFLLRLFQVWSSDRQFVSLFSDEPGSRALAELELEWPDPHVSHLLFGLDFTSRARSILCEWEIYRPAFERDFGVRFTHPAPHMHMGSPSQAFLSSPSGIGVWFSSHYPVSEGMRGFLVCFDVGFHPGSIPMRYSSMGFLDVRALTVAAISSAMR